MIKNQVSRAVYYYIEAILLIKVYHSEAGYKSLDEVNTEYYNISSETFKLEVIKKQIRIRVNVYGWEKILHPWSRNRYHFTSTELKDYFINRILLYKILLNNKILTDLNIDLRTDKVKFKLGNASEDVN